LLKLLANGEAEVQAARVVSQTEAFRRAREAIRRTRQDA